MKILHITPHLGGGMGKAHAAMRRHMPRSVQQTFLLLEWPINKRHVNDLKEHGARVLLSGGPDHIAALARQADIVQFEYINHPLILQAMATVEFDLMRCVIWSHVSGIFKPLLRPELLDVPHLFVFSSAASQMLAKGHDKTAVINSGFGFAAHPPKVKRIKPSICYLGTVDFVKMHDGIFDAVDRMQNDIEFQVWGHINPACRERAASMKNRHRVKFCDHTEHPAEALNGADIFFYPLQRWHYGTGENALVEAMDLGLVPVVLDNPAEKQIVVHNECGLIAQNMGQCTRYLDSLINNVKLRESLSKGAQARVKATRMAEYSANEFIALWKAVLEQEPRRCDFANAIGDNPYDWFLSTQVMRGMPATEKFDLDEPANKGRLSHFHKAFPEYFQNTQKETLRNARA